MAERTIKTRMVQKHDTSENWAKALKFAPLCGEIVIYDDLNKFKIGDGKTYVNDLPFASGEDLNIERGSGNASLQQTFDSTSTLDFTGKNPALTADNVVTYFGEGADITKLPKGGLGAFSSSFGGKTIAKGKRSIAQGTTTVAIGAYSHTEGDNTVAIGNDSHAEGYQTSAEGIASHSEGLNTHAEANHSHTEGGNTQTAAGADCSHAEGLGTEVSGKYAHAEGNGTKAGGVSSHAEGEKTKAEGTNSHSEGVNTAAKANCSHAEGNSTEATGSSAHSEGYITEARGEGSHSEGSGTLAAGRGSHAEGEETIAEGNFSHAEGSETATLANFSHVEGARSVIHKDLSQFTEQGESTITPPPPEGGSGGGDSDTTWKPDEHMGIAAHAEGYNGQVAGFAGHAEGFNTVALSHYSHAEGTETKAGKLKNNTITGLAAHAEGISTKAEGEGSHSEGISATAKGNYSHAEGENTQAVGIAAHASGKQTQAMGNYSFAIGYNSTAHGTYSFAGGSQSIASGNNSFAFGNGSQAKANNSVALMGGTTDNNTKFAIGDFFTIDSKNSVKTKVDINAAFVMDNSSNGWVKFAYLPFQQYIGGSALINVKQSYVGEKYNALIELAVTTIDNGFHDEQGFVFRQVAGQNIADKVGYVKDSSNNITFYIKKGTYGVITANLLSNKFEHLVFYSNGNAETPTLTGYLDGGLLTSDLSDYYTKSQVDSKLSSVYKFKGTAIVPLELGYKTVEQGDVYNCQVGGNFCPYIKQSALDLVSMNLDSVNKKITLNFATSMSDILASPEVVIDTVYIAENIARTNGFVYGDVVSHGDNYITVNYSKYETALLDACDRLDPIAAFYYEANQALEAGDKVTIECFIGALKSTYYYSTEDEKVSVNSGSNVAWTGTAWDNLGGYVDISAKADKSATLSGYGITDAYTKAEVDSKIAAAIETALDTEV